MAEYEDENVTAPETDSDDGEVLAAAKKAFQRAEDAESHIREESIEDIRFARLGEQWPADIRKEREQARRPCLTINRLPAVTRQVVNDSRQNRPQIRVLPVDDKADPKTAQVINGLIRNIESVSCADVAYDTAIECAVDGGFGYFRISIDYTFDDAFDQDILIERVPNQFSVYGDPDSTSADSSDWNTAFVVTRLTKDEYERQYGEGGTVDWDSDAWSDNGTQWLNEDGVLVAEWWKREEVEREIALLDDGRVLDVDALLNDEDMANALSLGLLNIVATRKTKTHKVTQHILSGEKVLKTNQWPGRYIPIVPVYGEELNVEGKRYFRSLIHHAKDAQRMVNYWRSTGTELVALAPRVPFIGPKGAFDSDAANWSTANTENHAYLEYDGQIPPQRQPLDTGVAGGALQEALNASDDIKAITGIYDASLGARSNETSGRAIMARQREGDVSTFHFIDNLTRAIRHAGKIILDLIPHVYSGPRIVRVLGEDGQEQAVKVNQPVEQMDPETGQPIVDEAGQVLTAIHDLTVGKYDLIVTAGPSFTSRREEAAQAMTQLIQAYPAAAPLLADILAESLDFPKADEVAKRMKALVPDQGDGIPPQVKQMIEAGQRRLQQQDAVIAELRRLLAEKQTELQVKARDVAVKEGQLAVKAKEADIKEFDAVTDRIDVVGEQRARAAETALRTVQPVQTGPAMNFPVS